MTLNPKLQSHFLISGVTRNCETKLRDDVFRLLQALGDTKKLHWLLIESDSDDSTVNILTQLSNEIDNFRFISLGTLRSVIPLRTQRIAHCRNTYLHEIRHNKLYENIDFVIIADFDGINSKITEGGIESCWTRDDWDMCAANQKGPYYDIWALRHEAWSPNDCLEQLRFLNIYSKNIEKNLYACIYSRMISIPTNSDWIEVDSAFGGLAIYKKSLFNLSEYSGLNDLGEEVCEHVLFHRRLKQFDVKIYINPKMINAEYTEHTKHLRFPHSVLRKLKISIKYYLNIPIDQRFSIISALNKIRRKKLAAK